MNIEARVTDDPIIREEVFAHIIDTFGVHIHRYIPNFFGLYNMKWIVTTNSKILFIKCYHPKRYRLSDPHRRLKIGRSLFFQHLLHDEADVCPGIWSKDGEFIFKSESGHFYVIMEHFEGRSPHAGLVDIDTMYRLGKATGRMHTILSRFPAEGDVWIPSIAAMKEQWGANLKNALSQSTPNEKVIRFIEKQGLILSDLDLSIFNEF